MPQRFGSFLGLPRSVPVLKPGGVESLTGDVIAVTIWRQQVWVPLLWLPIALPVLRPQSFVSFPGASGNVIYSESRELGSSLGLPVALFEATGVGFFHGTAHVIAYCEATVVGYICVNTHSIAFRKAHMLGPVLGVPITSAVLKSQDFG